jgi:hypothetical protein
MSLGFIYLYRMYLRNNVVRRTKGGLQTEEFFTARARRADPGKIARILKRVGKGNPPVEGDELPPEFMAKNEEEQVSGKNLGSSIDDFLKKEGIFEEAQAQAIKEVVAWQRAKAKKKKKTPRRASRSC